MTLLYNSSFYSNRDSETSSSAEAVIDCVLNITKPLSVVDVGCGVGTWLRIFKKQGCKRILGIDRDEVPRKSLQIEESEFLATQLEVESIPAIAGRFDLVVSLEVAEHLNPSVASRFVQTLTELGPIVLFSAAIPHQGGVHHVNEQWQDYWRQLFAERGYSCFDVIRPMIWDNAKVYYWYRQNTFLYACKEAHPRLRLPVEFNVSSPKIISVVHPEAFMKKCTEITELSRPLSSIRATMRSLLKLIAQRLKGALKNICTSGPKL